MGSAGYDVAASSAALASIVERVFYVKDLGRSCDDFHSVIARPLSPLEAAALARI